MALDFSLQTGQFSLRFPIFLADGQIQEVGGIDVGETRRVKLVVNISLDRGLRFVIGSVAIPGCNASVEDIVNAAQRLGELCVVIYVVAIHNIGADASPLYDCLKALALSDARIRGRRQIAATAVRTVAFVPIAPNLAVSAGAIYLRQRFF